MLPLRMWRRWRDKGWRLGAVLRRRLRAGSADVGRCRRRGRFLATLSRPLDIGMARRHAVQTLEEMQEATDFRMDDLVTKLDESDSPNVDATFCVTRSSLPLALLPGLADCCAKAVVGAEDPEDGFEMREDAGKEEEPNLVEAREEPVVIERGCGCERGELVGEGCESGANQVGQVGDKEAGDER